jgi:hypothetical protein
VGLGGVFLGTSGKYRMHVMPDFSSPPPTCSADVDKWLQFYEMSAPIVFLSVFISRDLPGMELRLEHTHGFSEHGDAGHYHYDTTPDDVEYVGYFNIAEGVF